MLTNNSVVLNDLLPNYKKVEELLSVLWFLETMSTTGHNIAHPISRFLLKVLTHRYSETSLKRTACKTNTSLRWIVWFVPDEFLRKLSQRNLSTADIFFSFCANILLEIFLNKADWRSFYLNTYFPNNFMQQLYVPLKYCNSYFLFHPFYSLLLTTVTWNF